MAWRPPHDPKGIHARDGYTCQCCGLPGTEVHHIHWRADGGKCNQENLITLCDDCHRKAPHMDGFLAFQRKGGDRSHLLEQLSPGQRADLFLALPFKPNVPASWHKKRVEWLVKLRAGLGDTPA
jgi:hypothetical protein